ncbi:MAG: radical SAM protein [Planctomycetes bacterium]|nr:radical SAM protein [Planctomycetota bacterium]
MEAVHDDAPQNNPAAAADGSRLIRQAQRRAVKNGRAFDVVVELTHRCNVACRHCYILPGAQELSLQQWDGVLAQMADHGVFVLTVTGGEPTLYPGFFDFIELTTRYSFAIRLFSNLTTLSEVEIDRLREANILAVEATIHSADPQAHDHFCRSPGAFEKTISTLKLMKEKGFPLTIKTTWSRCNHKDPERVFQFARELGILLRTSPSMTPRRDMSTNHFDWRLSDDELFDVFMEIIRITGSKEKYSSCDSYQLPPDDSRFCGAGVATLRVGPSGKVYPCVEIQACVGDLTEQSFDDIWYNAPMLKELRRLRVTDAKECVACADRKFCARCLGQAYNEGAGLCGPAQDACRIARVNRRIFEVLSEGQEATVETSGRPERQ